MAKQIIPITERDFQALEEIILKNSDKFCSYCNGELEKHTLKDGKIIYLCYRCDTVWEKETIDENHFKLVESKEGLAIY